MQKRKQLSYLSAYTFLNLGIGSKRKKPRGDTSFCVSRKGFFHEIG